MVEAWKAVGDKILHQKGFNTNFASGAIINKWNFFGIDERSQVYFENYVLKYICNHVFNTTQNIIQNMYICQTYV
jgi:hypothetical protein